MIKSLIVEDKTYIRQTLKSMLKSINAGVQIIEECEYIQEAVIVTKSCQPELVFFSSIFGRLEQKSRLLK